MQTNKQTQLFSLLLILFSLVGCGPKTAEKTDKKLNIVATTGMLADAARQIGGEKADVTALMGPGVDPHLYKAAQSDLQRLRDADVVLFNGLHLEGKLAEVLNKLGQTKPVFAPGDSLPKAELILLAENPAVYDPHIWFEPELWRMVTQNIAQTLCRIDPENAAYYRQNAAAYLVKLADTENAIRAKIDSLPPKQRVLITAHDAFGYFARAYGFEVKSLQGVSTAAEYGLQDVTKLVDFIVERKIKAVFVESAIPPRSIEAVVEGCRSKGHSVKIGGSLFSDALGDPASPAGDYPGMTLANAATIVNALR